MSRGIRVQGSGWISRGIAGFYIFGVIMGTKVYGVFWGSNVRKPLNPKPGLG